MNDSDRDRLREKQDRVIAYADHIHNHANGLRLTTDSASPTIAEMRQYIFPEWEACMDRILRERELSESGLKFRSIP